MKSKLKAYDTGGLRLAAANTMGSELCTKVGGGGTPAASIAAPSRLVFKNNRLLRDIAMVAPPS